MQDYIIEEEQFLSPVVVVTTALMVAVFGIGLLYQIASFVL
jgi:hypothetical protein